MGYLMAIWPLLEGPPTGQIKKNFSASPGSQGNANRHHSCSFATLVALPHLWLRHTSSFDMVLDLPYF
jgi:hypothetical protein